MTETFKVIMDFTLGISKSVFILITIIFLYSLSRREIIRSGFLRKMFRGVFMAAAILVIMTNSWSISSGQVFDARTVLLVLSGAYFGLIPTLMALLTGIAYRIFALPASGVIPGIFSMIISSGVGLTFGYNHEIITIKNFYIRNYLLGLVAHFLIVVMYVPFIFVNVELNNVYGILMAFLGVYPLAIMLLAAGLENQKELFFLETSLRKEKSILSSTLNSSQIIEIFSLDREYRYLSFNEYHKKSMKEHYNADIRLNDNFIDVVNIPALKDNFISKIDKFFSGKEISKEYELQVSEKKFLKEIYAPIYDKKKVVGLTIFIFDITKEKEQEQKIIDLSFLDALTGVYNRRFYQEKLIELQDQKYLPLTILIADMNGLKAMNDAFGHQEGDRLLITFATLLKKHFDNGSYVCRVGGDEFVIFLINKETKEAQEKIDLVTYDLLTKGTFNFPVSFSYGISTKTNGKNIQFTIHEAEAEMYQHKLVSGNSHRSLFIKSLINTLYQKYPDMKNSTSRVTHIAKEIGKELKFSSTDLELLGMISTIFDIGKIAIGENIINKPDKLTASEWKEVRKHPEIGYHMLAASPEYASIAIDVLYHQERYDGKGYPVGLKQDEIPLKSRIISVADAYVSMTSPRPYRKTFSHQEAIQELIKCSGSQFDPEIVTIFVKLFKNKQI